MPRTIIRTPPEAPPTIPPIMAAFGPLYGTGGGLEFVAGGLDVVSVEVSDELDVGKDNSDDVDEDSGGDVMEPSDEVEDCVG